MTPELAADLKTDLLNFTVHMFRERKGTDLMRAAHQDLICAALERVIIGHTKRLIINMPPRSGKTELAVVSFIAWCMGNWPHSHFIHASYSKRLAATNTYAVRSVMQHEGYAQIFPGVKLAGDSTAKDEFRTNAGGVVYAAGSEGTITGYGAGSMDDLFGGAIVIDDPHKAGEANSAIMRQNVIDWFSTTMESRKNSPDTPIIIVMQRLHENDLTGWLLGGGNGEHWEHLCIPAVNEQGESFWPEQFPLDMLERLKASNNYVYAGQYLQTPAPLGGGVFKESWLRYWTTLPKIEHCMIYSDTAHKTGQENDRSWFQLWGKGKDGNAYLIDMIMGRWESPQLLANAKAFWDKCRANAPATVRKLKIEDKASGIGLVQQLKQEGIPVEGIPRNRDKLTRGYDTAPMVEAGRVFLPERHPALSDMLHEISLFPVATHDDAVDPFMDAIQDMLIERSHYSWSGFL